MQSDLEREMSRQLSLMQQLAVDPWPAFETELHFDWCCECPKKWHAFADTSARHRTECGLCGDPHTYRRGRHWRADFAFLAPYNLLIEVDGAVFTSGRHTRGKGYEEDARKNARAVELGFRTLRFSGGQVKSGEALNAIGACLGVGNGV